MGVESVDDNQELNFDDEKDELKLEDAPSQEISKD